MYVISFVPFMTSAAHFAISTNLLLLWITDTEGEPFLVDFKVTKMDNLSMHYYCKLESTRSCIYKQNRGVAFKCECCKLMFVMCYV